MRKTYIKPKMEVVKLHQQIALMAGSFTDSTSGVGFDPDDDSIENSDDIG